MTTIHHRHIHSSLPTVEVPTAKDRPATIPINQLLEDALRTLLHQHYPTYMRFDGRELRNTLNKAFVEFIVERSRGNQKRASETAGFNRNTLRRLIRAFGVDWKRHARQGKHPT